MQVTKEILTCLLRCDGILFLFRSDEDLKSANPEKYTHIHFQTSKTLGRDFRTHKDLSKEQPVCLSSTRFEQMRT